MFWDTVGHTFFCYKPDSKVYLLVPIIVHTDNCNHCFMKSTSLSSFWLMMRHSCLKRLPAKSRKRHDTSSDRERTFQHFFNWRNEGRIDLFPRHVTRKSPFFSLPRTFFFLRRRRNHCCLRLLDRLSIHLFYSQMSFATKIFFRLALFLSVPEGKLINQQSDLDLHLYFGWGQARKHLF